MEEGEATATVVVLVEGGKEVTIACLDGHPVDLALVDVLARLQLAARRGGADIVVRRPSPQLRELLDLVGLAGLLTGGALPLDAVGEAEEPKQLGVEEVLPGGDLPV